MQSDIHFRQWRKMAAQLGDAELRDKIKTGDGATDDQFFGSAAIDPTWFDGARSILDFGAGLGRNAPPLLRMRDDVDLLLFDSPEMIERAREKLAERLAPAEFARVAFSNDWSHAANHSFDLVFCSLVLQHITPPALLVYLESFKVIAPRLLVFGRRWNDGAGRGSSTWEVIARSGWRVVRCDESFGLAQGAEIHNRVLLER